MPTPHNSAVKGDFAKTVLMPGDPLRSKYIAENFLTEAKLVNNVRGVQGFTGLWKGAKVSVQASGMGIPSIGIYSWELFKEYGVENIIRIGSAGGLADDLKLMDVVAAVGACTDSNFAHQFGVNGTFAPTADWTLLSTAMSLARERGLSIRAVSYTHLPRWSAWASACSTTSRGRTLWCSPGGGRRCGASCPPAPWAWPPLWASSPAG